LHAAKLIAALYLAGMTLGIFDRKLFLAQTFNFELQVIQINDALEFKKFVKSNEAVFRPQFPVTSEAATRELRNVKHWIEQKLTDMHENRSLCLVVRKIDTHEIVAFLTAFAFDWRTPKCEIAWMLATDWQGMGIASMGLTYLIQHLFLKAGLVKIICRIQPNNLKSLKLAARLGFIKEGLHRKDFRDGLGNLVDIEYMAIWQNNLNSV
jgi:RimJ/RimL family protein N-acetyltransferase